MALHDALESEAQVPEASGRTLAVSDWKCPEAVDISEDAMVEEGYTPAEGVLSNKRIKMDVDD